jgi:hypothetical protein
MSAAAVQVPRTLKREYLRKPPDGATRDLPRTLFHEACAVLLLVVAALFWGGASLIPGAEPSLAVAGCVAVAAIAAVTCTRFFVGVRGKTNLANTGFLTPRDGYARPFGDALMTVLAFWLVASLPFVLATTFADASSLAAADPQATEQGRYYLAGDLFLWHLLDALPFLDATDTLKWNEPVKDYSGVTGSLLVAYKALFVTPGVLVARRAWKDRRQPSPA